MFMMLQKNTKRQNCGIGLSKIWKGWNFENFDFMLSSVWGILSGLLHKKIYFFTIQKFYVIQKGQI